MIDEMIVLYDWEKATNPTHTINGEITHLEYLYREELRILKKSDDRKVTIETKGPMMRLLVNNVAGSSDLSFT